MSARRISFAALLSLPILAVSAPVPKKAVPPPLDGTWQVVEWHTQGTKADPLPVVRWVVTGETLTIEGGRGPRAGLKVKPVLPCSLIRPKDGGPTALDFVTHPAGGSPDRTFPGVAEVDGDTLRFCFAATAGGERPAKMEPGVGNVLYVLERVKDEPKKDK